MLVCIFTVVQCDAILHAHFASFQSERAFRFARSCTGTMRVLSGSWRDASSSLEGPAGPGLFRHPSYECEFGFGPLFFFLSETPATILGAEAGLPLILSYRRY